MLFQKDNDGKTVHKRDIEKDGNVKIFKVKTVYCHRFSSLPILHHVDKYAAPNYMNDFTSRYPSALYHRDENGRTLTQAATASGAKTFQNINTFIEI